jgi:hypothetical protein
MDGGQVKHAAAIRNADQGVRKNALEVCGKAVSEQHWKQDAESGGIGIVPVLR